MTGTSSTPASTGSSDAEPPPALVARGKDQSVETLRGVAILLMVAGHVIGGDDDSGMRVDPASWWRYGYFSFQFLRMPLFTVISGYVYALKPVQPGVAMKFLTGKGRRILLPLVSIGTLQFVLRALVPGVNRPVGLSEIWKIYLFPFDQFWFLQSIFLVFVTVTVLEVLRGMATCRRWLLVLVVAVAASLFVPRVTKLFSFPGYLYLLPFFILGCGLRRYEADLRRHVVTVLATVCLVIGIAVQQWSWFSGQRTEGFAMEVLAVVVGLTGTLLFFRFRRACHWLARLGFYSYGIYLLHVFGTASSRMLLGRLGARAELVVFVVSMVCGMLGPIVAEYFILKSKVSRRLLLGLR